MSEQDKKNLSPIARRAFFKKVGGAAVAGVVAGVGINALTGCIYSDYSDSCGYCNGGGRNYYHCDGSYCNYINYCDGTYC